MNTKKAKFALNRSVVAATADGAIYWKEEASKTETFDLLFEVCTVYGTRLLDEQVFRDTVEQPALSPMNRLVIALDVIREYRPQLAEVEHGVDIFSITIILLKMLLRAITEPKDSFLLLVKFYMNSYQYSARNGEVANLLTMSLYRGVESLN